MPGNWLKSKHYEFDLGQLILLVIVEPQITRAELALQRDGLTAIKA